MDHKNILSNDYFKNKLNWKQVCCSKLDKITENFEIHNSKSWSVKYLSLDKKKGIYFHISWFKNRKNSLKCIHGRHFPQIWLRIVHEKSPKVFTFSWFCPQQKAPVTTQVVNCKLPTLLIRHLHTFGQKRDWNETLTFLERTRIFS